MSAQFEPLAFAAYHSLTTFIAYLHLLEVHYPEWVSIHWLTDGTLTMPIVMITHQRTGRADDKPAIWLNGSAHGGTRAPAELCMALIQRLVVSDLALRPALNQMAWYICPFVYDADERQVRIVPPALFDQAAIVPADVDNDGHIRYMRIPNPDGAWKINPENPRLMIRRRAGEWGDLYFDVIPEGDRADAGTPAPITHPLDLDAVIAFIDARANIDIVFNCEGTGGYFAHPVQASGVLQDVYLGIADKATMMTRLPCLDVPLGHADQLNHLSANGARVAWHIALWSVQHATKLAVDVAYPGYPTLSINDQISILVYAHDHWGGEGYAEWKPFDHPTFGMIEIGGWDIDHLLINPPAECLEATLEPVMKWLLLAIQQLPQLDIQCTVESDGGVYKLRSMIKNLGGLPTNINSRPSDMTRLIVELQLPDGVRLRAGTVRIDLGNLDEQPDVEVRNPTQIRDAVRIHRSSARVEWLIDAPKGTAVQVTAHHPRAGWMTETVRLE